MEYDVSFDNPRKSYQYKSWSMTVVRSRLEIITFERSKSNGIPDRRYQVIISCIQGYSCTTMECEGNLGMKCFIITILIVWIAPM